MSEPSLAGHPDDLVTAAYLDGTLAAESRDRFEAHLAECDMCRAGVTLLRSAQSDETSVPLAAVRRAAAVGRSRQPRSRLLLALAASVILVGALTMILRLGPGRPAPSPVRGNPPAFTGLSPSGSTVVAPSHVMFRWSPIDGADRYELSVFDATGKKVAEATVSSPEDSAPWPEDAPPPAPGAYVWKVRAMALDRVVAESDPTAFEVGP